MLLVCLGLLNLNSNLGIPAPQMDVSQASQIQHTQISTHPLHQNRTKQKPCSSFCISRLSDNTCIHSRQSWEMLLDTSLSTYSPHSFDPLVLLIFFTDINWSSFICLYSTHPGKSLLFFFFGLCECHNLIASPCHHLYQQSIFYQIDVWCHFSTLP